MKEWWRKHIKLIAKSGMNKKIAEDIAEKKLLMRKGTKKLLKTIIWNENVDYFIMKLVIQ
jgi:hypothetical protein